MKYVLSITTAIVLLSSCVTTNYISIDIREPAAVSFAAQIQNIVIVDNTPNTSINIDTIAYNSDFRQTLQLPTDSAKSTFINSLAQFIEDENYFTKVSKYPINTRGENKPFEELSVSPKSITEICEKTNADALISIDDFSLNVTLQNITDSPIIEQLFELALLSNLKVYDAAGNRLSVPINVSDTIFWGTINRIDTLPNFDKVNAQIAIIAADKLTNVFIPYWKKQDRWYYTGGSSAMKKADKFVQEGKWLEAATIWGEAFEKEENPLRQARMASNIALANECLDDVPNALKWIDIAFELIPKHNNSSLATLTSAYKKELKKREQNIEKLEIQLGTSSSE